MKTTIIGVTGGIGSGKSVVCRLLQLMGIPVYISDEETRRVMADNAAIREALIGLVGPECYVGTTLQKPTVLAAYLFGSEQHARQVNALIHPQVKADFRRWVARHADAPVVAMESAILIEAGFRDTVDCVLLVSSPLELRVDRAMKRDGASREQIEQRISRQLGDDEKRTWADYEIVNDDVHALIPQLKHILQHVFGR